MTSQTATIHVYNSEPGTEDMRWFELPDRLYVDSYYCTPWDAVEFGPATPHPDNVREVARLHPGCDYIFLDTGDGSVAREAGLTQALDLGRPVEVKALARPAEVAA